MLGFDKLTELLQKNPRVAFSFGAVLVILCLYNVSTMLFNRSDQKEAEAKEEAKRIALETKKVIESMQYRIDTLTVWGLKKDVYYNVQDNTELRNQFQEMKNQLSKTEEELKIQRHTTNKAEKLIDQLDKKTEKL